MSDIQLLLKQCHADNKVAAMQLTILMHAECMSRRNKTMLLEVRHANILCWNDFGNNIKNQECNAGAIWIIPSSDCQI